MESFQDRSSAADRGSGSRVNQPREGKLGRIAGHTRGLVDDLREWIDLRLDLAILELEERVDDLRNEVALGLVLAFFGFMAALFVLTTVAIGLGWALGHPFWGFLIVTALLVLLVTVLARTRPDLVPSSNLFERVRGRSRQQKDISSEVERPEASTRESQESSVTS